MERLATPDYGAQWVMVREYEETLVRPVPEQDDDALLDPDWDELG